MLHDNTVIGNYQRKKWEGRIPIFPLRACQRGVRLALLALLFKFAFKHRVLTKS
jgi:hypothetical protein